MREALTFDDVALVPQFNNVPSRTEPDLRAFFSGGPLPLYFDHPIVPSNMDTVMSTELAQKVVLTGGIPILHRFQKMESVLEQVTAVHGTCFVSWGVKDLKNLKVLFDACERKPYGVCFDQAHGHSIAMQEAMNFVRHNIDFDGVGPRIIAGNVCTAQGYSDLVNWGADAVKVGIGPGAACTTRSITGFGVPQFSAIRDCYEVAKKLCIPIIADGGIRGSDDVVKALAAGASTVMVGKLFAACNESAAPKAYRQACEGKDGHPGYETCHAHYRGQASEDFQLDYFGGLREGTVAEGEDFWTPVTGTFEDVLQRLLGGLRSGLTYGGAKSIKELQRKAEFVKVGHGYERERSVRS